MEFHSAVIFFQYATKEKHPKKNLVAFFPYKHFCSFLELLGLALINYLEMIFVSLHLSPLLGV